MQTQKTITLFGTVSNSATSRISKNGSMYTTFGVAIISDRNRTTTSSPAASRATSPSLSRPAPVSS